MISARRAGLAILIATIMAISSSDPSIGQLNFPFLNWDHVVSERSWTGKTKPPTDTLILGWIPTLERTTTLYFLRAVCHQLDDFDDPAGKNKVFFEDILLTGVDSGNAVGAQRVARAIKKGKGKVALWDLTPHMPAFDEDSIVLVTGDTRATKKVPGFHTFVCDFSVLELFDVSNLRGRTKQERLRYYEEVAESESLGAEPRGAVAAQAPKSR